MPGYAVWPRGKQRLEVGFSLGALSLAIVVAGQQLDHAIVPRHLVEVPKVILHRSGVISSDVAKKSHSDLSRRSTWRTSELPVEPGANGVQLPALHRSQRERHVTVVIVRKSFEQHFVIGYRLLILLLSD